jgi:hypothetical protein
MAPGRWQGGRDGGEGKEKKSLATDLLTSRKGKRSSNLKLQVDVTTA